MTSAPAVPFVVLGFAGLILLLGDVPALRRRSLASRLAPYVPGAHVARGVDRRSSLALGPTVRDVGDRLAAWLGVPEPMDRRLRRLHAADSAVAVRLAQAGRTGVAFVLGAITATVVAAPPALALLLVVGPPLLVFLGSEQRMTARSRRWQHDVAAELPVVAEQLGMLLGAGWSLGAALTRLADRGHGPTAQDLRRVTGRIQQGLTEVEALREWTDVAGVAAVDRLVSVLALHHETADLARLVAEEARAIRREGHRELIEAIERRNQQVWIPVTVAALIPGTLLLGVPFVDALSAFAAT